MSERIGNLQGAISAEGITTREFPTRLRGYDRDEVDAFLAVIAEEFSHLLTKISPIDEDKPFEQLGAEAGRLLELAREAAATLEAETAADLAGRRRQLEEEIAAARKETEDRRAEIERDAARIVSEAEAEAAQTIEQAQKQKEMLVAEAEHLRERSEGEAQRLRSKAEAEYQGLLREARRKSQTADREAREQAARIRESAQEEAAENLQIARSEVRKLRETAATLNQHIENLTAQKEALELDRG